ncbi:PREDICTED: von Willebrand factor A domain-containing protein 7-like [Gekko japonicus]|uniref:von Willebrand factor A domain-containing protein 7-like n=1 Tax=Gekko japonicus TaxID=146911 RepID=A0ABM1KF91_GEKJA|nr:PREDICTED: von Willebrand factor A domain-containing protein 7-like [Gekko japonicus]
MGHTLGSFWSLLWTLMLLRFPLQGVYGFFPNFWSRPMTFAWGSVTHQDMTEDAILSVTLRLFTEVPHPKGKRIREEDFQVMSLWCACFLRTPEDPGTQAGAPPEQPADTQTCSSCPYWTCEGNLVESLATKGLLTTGYYGTKPEKPKGKCSHGGTFDDSRYRDPHGGINKDSSSFLFSPHHYLHSEAAVLAQEASTHFLEMLWRDIGSKQFMRPLLPKLPSNHLMVQTGVVTVNYFGPMLKTSDPEKFWELLDTIHPLGGKDEPEMCLSALELALQNSPPYSELFVFTDASAKDAHLKNSVEALIQEQKCKVTFLITEDPSRTRVKRETLAPDRFNLYIDLAHSSGGQILFTNNENIRRVAEVIGESSISSVTLFSHQKGAIFSLEDSPKRTRRQAAKQEVHPFWIDSLVDKVVMTIQGAIWAFTIRDPTGSAQRSTLVRGPLAEIQSIGGIYRVLLLSPVLPGEWTLTLHPTGNYSVHIQGQSTLDFLHYFAVPVDGRHPGLLKMDSSPIEGVPVYLVVTATGLSQPESGSVQLEAVNLAGKTGSLGEMHLQRDANKTDLFVAKLPPSLLANGSFTVILRGVDSEGRKVERAAPQVATVVGSLLELSRDTPVFPGKPVSVTWKLTNPGSLKQYGLKASSVPQLPVNISSSRLRLGLNETETGQITLQVPGAAVPGSVITITLQAGSLHPAGDPTFAHIHLLVMPPPPVRNFSLPFCNASWVRGSCGPSPLQCHAGHWTATLRIWDEAGVRSVQAEGGAVVPHQADGPAESVSYTSDCCSREATLVVTNRLGEKYRCRVEAPREVPGKVVGSTLPETPSRGAAAAAVIAPWWQVLVAFLVTCSAL